MDGRTLQKFSPRKKNSPWGELNKEKCSWLIKNNFLRIQKLSDLEEMFVLDEDILRLLKQDKDI